MILTTMDDGTDFPYSLIFSIFIIYSFISEADLKELLSTMGEKVTDEELTDMIREVDADLDGQVVKIPTYTDASKHRSITNADCQAL